MLHSVNFSLLCKENAVRWMWKHLRERFHIVKVRVLHPQISKNSSVAILRGVLKGSWVRPTLFGIFVAALIHELREKFPNATITHNGGIRWIWEILYVDDLFLISTNAHELQMMINTHVRLGAKRPKCNSTLTKRKLCVFMKPRKYAMQGKTHGKFRETCLAITISHPFHESGIYKS